MFRTRKWALVMAMLVTTCCVLPQVAFGEFLSSKSKGSGEVTELKLEAGGGKAVCQNFLHPTKDIGWIVRSGGTETTKGASLLSNIEHWGECTLESSGIAKTKATLSSCDLELTQTGTTKGVPGKLAKVCSVTTGSCEIKAEPASNTSLSITNLWFSGESDENLVLEPAISNLTTLATGCGGISGTTKGKLSGYAELEHVKPGGVMTFSLNSPKRLYTVGEKGKVVVANKGEESVLEFWGTFELAGSMKSNAVQEETCKTMNYPEKSSCSFEVEATKAGFRLWNLEVGGAGALVLLTVQ